MDLIIRRANLPDGRNRIDVGIEGGRIVAVEPQLQAAAIEEIDADGRLLSPPFVDAHFHLDATLSLGLPRMNRSGTLLEGIALWGELKPRLTLEAVISRALAYCDMAVAQGLLAIRSHVDVCDDRLACGGGASGGEKSRRTLSRSSIGSLSAGWILPLGDRRA